VAWTMGYQFLLNAFRTYRNDPGFQNREKIEAVLKNLANYTPDTLAIDSDEQIRVWLQHLERNKIPILTPRLIQIVWIGTEDERRRARYELQKLTGQNFQTAKEWTTWWRKKVEIVEKLTN